MTFALRILPRAWMDLQESTAYIARDSVEVALRLGRAFRKTCNEIVEHPLRWPVYDSRSRKLSRYRRRAVPVFDKYLIFYVVEGGEVQIVRLLHGA